MWNIDKTWQGLAPGMALVGHYQRELEAQWREPLRQERERRERQARAVLQAHEAERAREHDAAVAAREAREAARLEQGVAKERAAWAERVRPARERLADAGLARWSACRRC